MSDAARRPDIVGGWNDKLQSTLANITPAGVRARIHRQNAAPGATKQG